MNCIILILFTLYIDCSKYFNFHIIQNAFYMRFFATFFFCILATIAWSQQTESKRINIGTYPLLKGYSIETVQEGTKFTYSLIDENNQGKRIFTFSPPINTSENFIEGFYETVQDFFLEENNLQDKLNNFYKIVQISSAAILENEKGPEVMTMYFSPDVNLSRSPNRANQPVKRKDVIKLYNISFKENLSLGLSRNKIFKTDTLSKIPREIKLTIDAKKVTNSEKYLELYNKIVESKEEESLRKLDESKTANNEQIIEAENLKSNITNLEYEIDYLKTKKSNNTISLNNKNEEVQNFQKDIKSEIDRLNQEFKTANGNVDSTSFREISELANKVNSGLDPDEYNHVEIPEFKSPKTDSVTNQEFNIQVYSAKEAKDKFNTYTISIHSKIENIESSKTELKKLEEENLKLDSMIGIQKDQLSRSKWQYKKQTDSINSSLKQTISKMWDESSRRLSVESIQLEINRGFIENLIVTGVSYLQVSQIQSDFLKENLDSLTTGPRLKLINDYPLGISSKLDIERLKNIRLHSRYENENHFELRIGDVITNIEEILALDRRDYSPKDDGYYIQIGQTPVSHRFYKNPTREILEARIYTDALGLNEENPNGLIQIEVAKEIPLVTSRYQKAQIIGLTRWFFNKKANVGFLNYLRPDFTFSKIEQNNRYLPIYQFPNKDTLSFTTSAFELKQYESYSIGMDLNLLYYDLPYAKSTFLINGGFRFGRTYLTSDPDDPSLSILPKNFTNTLQPSFDFTWRVNGDERFGLETTYSLLFLYSDEAFFEQKSELHRLDLDTDISKAGKSAMLNRVTIQAYLNLNEERQSRVFMRYRVNTEFGAWKLNFSQLQFGITTFILSKNGYQ